MIVLTSFDLLESVGNRLDDSSESPGLDVKLLLELAALEVLRLAHEFAGLVVYLHLTKEVQDFDPGLQVDFMELLVSQSRNNNRQGLVLLVDGALVVRILGLFGLDSILLHLDDVFLALDEKGISTV